MGTFLIVEDEVAVSYLLRVALFGSHAVKVAATFQEFLDLLPDLEVPLVVLVDEDFPGGSGAKVAQILRERIPAGLKLISTSARYDNEITWRPDVRLPKPFSLTVARQKAEECMAACLSP